ncbi:hypothetical protein GGR57DRAFT_500161 [Xylariaceae sp. FL1272]|nr:hypothetical protein GGR57DRAFT_500161 [Xylariaceae sp. FL1272]
MQILLAVLTLASAVAARSLPRLVDSVPEGYTIADITWTMPIVEGGPEHTFQGTAQQVFAQVNDKRKQLGLLVLDDSSLDDDIEAASNETESALSARSDIESRSYTKSICKVAAPSEAGKRAILDGVKYLNKLKSRCAMDGPKKCGRISCSYESAIWWCNDNHGVSEYPCSEFGPLAQQVVDHCSYLPFHNEWKTWGQAFDSRNFNVVCGYAAC